MTEPANDIGAAIRISAADRHRLLVLARLALEARVRRLVPPDPVRDGALDWRCGAFVSIHANGELRGCLGRLEADIPLAETIVYLAGMVADSDPRFSPVLAAELHVIDLEISVLTPESPIARPEEIELGRHGIIVEHGRRRGLLLPQVAAEHQWDRETLLTHACRKAALPGDAWRNGATIYVFEAEVFGDRG